MEVKKTVVTVSEMALMVNLSRARFYELVGTGTFPPPSYCTRTRRPVYVREQQERCLVVRRVNQGVNGRPVVFYARKAKGRTIHPKAERLTDTADPTILAGVRGLGLATATANQVDQAVKAVYPSGTAGIAEGVVIRSVFLHLARQNKVTA